MTMMEHIYEYIENKQNENIIMNPWIKDICLPMYNKSNVLITSSILKFLYFGPKIPINDSPGYIYVDEYKKNEIYAIYYSKDNIEFPCKIKINVDDMVLVKNYLCYKLSEYKYGDSGELFKCDFDIILRAMEIPYNNELLTKNLEKVLIEKNITYSKSEYNDSFRLIVHIDQFKLLINKLNIDILSKPYEAVEKIIQEYSMTQL
ncbi:ORF MSV191 MTG motif gene family protein [Melanoplus sanguinipes entomopoxvirus]|uniref:ORF MSV191 MTG motif gene family protein n=1 Tax=Melanoplus sanguinipes entomopoxvirus TaxID=83191 RepID=Q9YVQ1_MSEPV|nr:ORF MSV191 MTG motif gene family protein [Melanoplus sanguinipes entomopoxvirus]AAC97766.1 ORF MSV191 MTG motif gene family protein [Melanoplus sanguinipes entomopoxvirus 'O']